MKTPPPQPEIRIMQHQLNLEFEQNKDRVHIQEQLEKSILHGLSLEWDHALWVLNDVQRRGFEKPLFSLKDMGRRLGTWSFEKNEISLSRQQVLNGSWDATREDPAPCTDHKGLSGNRRAELRNPRTSEPQRL